eukprot:366081-Chlamydomonas_euryale.AAC.8
MCSLSELSRHGWRAHRAHPLLQRPTVEVGASFGACQAWGLQAYRASCWGFISALGAGCQASLPRRVYRCPYILGPRRHADGAHVVAVRARWVGHIISQMSTVLRLRNASCISVAPSLPQPRLAPNPTHPHPTPLPSTPHTPPSTSHTPPLSHMSGGHVSGDARHASGDPGGHRLVGRSTDSCVLGASARPAATLFRGCTTPRRDA